MPVVEVTALPQPAGVDVGAATAALARAVSSALGEEPAGTWVVWRTVEPGRYLEGADAPAVQPPSTHPPLARVIAYEGRPADLIARVLSAAAGALVAELGLEAGNAFVTWDEVHAGRVYTGGSVLGA
jgi:hypothetical protein